MRRLLKRIFAAGHYIRHGHLPENPADAISNLAGMTSIEERKFFGSCPSHLQGEKAVIVDLGCWLGSTTVSMAMGLRHQAAPNGKIYAFDRFIWEPWMDPFAASLSCDYRPGESFLPETRRRAADYRDIIEFIAADLTKYVWQDGPIDLLLVDAMKSNELATSISQNFYPYLTKGALLVHQDFKHYYTSWIHIIQYRFRDYFRFYHEVKDGCTVAFEVLTPIPPALATSLSNLDAVTDEEAEAAFAYSLGLVGPEGKPAVASAHIMHYVYAGRSQEALSKVDLYSKLPHLDNEFRIAKEKALAMTV